MERHIGRGRITKEKILATRKGWEALFEYVNETKRFSEIPRMKRIRIGKKDHVEILD